MPKIPDDNKRKKFPSDTGNGVLMTPIGYAASKMLGMRYELCTGRCLTDWEHGTPPKIIVSDFIFFSKLGKIGLKKVLGGVGFPHGTFFSPGASFSQWTFH